MKLIVNRVRGDLILNEKMMMPTDIEGLLDVELIGVLPEEDAIFLSNGNIPRSSDSYEAYNILAKNIVKNSNKKFDVVKKYTGFFGSIKRSLRKI